MRVCKRVLEGTMSLLAERMGNCIASKSFDSRDNILNKSKFSIHPLFDQLEVLTSADETECFSRNFSFNSTLNSSGVSCLMCHLGSSFCRVILLWSK